MTTVSLPFVWHWLKTGEVDLLHTFADHCCCFFVAYLARCDIPHILRTPRLDLIVLTPQRPLHRLNTLSIFNFASYRLDVSTCARFRVSPDSRVLPATTSHICYY